MIHPAELHINAQLVRAALLLIGTARQYDAVVMLRDVALALERMSERVLAEEERSKTICRS